MAADPGCCEITVVTDDARRCADRALNGESQSQGRRSGGVRRSASLAGGLRRHRSPLARAPFLPPHSGSRRPDPAAAHSQLHPFVPNRKCRFSIRSDALLGCGSFGKVYLALEQPSDAPPLDVPVAAKVYENRLLRLKQQMLAGDVRGGGALGEACPGQGGRTKSARPAVNSGRDIRQHPCPPLARACVQFPDQVRREIEALVLVHSGVPHYSVTLRPGTPDACTLEFNPARGVLRLIGAFPDADVPRPFHVGHRVRRARARRRTLALGSTVATELLLRPPSARADEPPPPRVPPAR